MSTNWGKVQSDGPPYNSPYTAWNASNSGTLPNPYVASNPLHYLMYATQQIADHFGSNGPYDGEGNNITPYNSGPYAYLPTFLPTLGPPTGQAEFSCCHDPAAELCINREGTSLTNRENIRDRTLPRAIQATAGLLYWFAVESELISTIIVKNDFNGGTVKVNNVEYPSGQTFGFLQGSTITSLNSFTQIHNNYWRKPNTWQKIRNFTVQETHYDSVWNNVLVDGNATYNATFNRLFNVTLTVAQPGSGGYYRVTGTDVGSTWSGTFLEGTPTPITLEAVPLSGYTFGQWSDGNAQNPRNLIPTDHVTLSATFISAPTNLIATAEFPYRVGLSWDAVPGAQAYQVYRGESETGTFTQVDDITSTSYLEQVPNASQTWYYYVKARVGSNIGPQSVTVYATPYHFASSSTNALSIGNQRKILRDHNGTYHAVYMSAGHIWYSKSTNGGTTWTPEQQVSDDPIYGSYNRYPTLTFQYNPSFSVVVLWEAYYQDAVGTNCYVLARTIGESGTVELDNIYIVPPQAFSTMPVASVSDDLPTHYPDHALAVWYDPTMPGIKAKIKDGNTSNWTQTYTLVEEPVSIITLAPNSRLDQPLDLAWATGNTMKYASIIILNYVSPPEFYLGSVETIVSGGGDITELSMVNVGTQPAVVWTENSSTSTVFFRQRTGSGSWAPTASFTHCGHQATNPVVGVYYEAISGSNFADLLWHCGDHIARVSRADPSPMWSPIVNLGQGSNPNISAAIQSSAPTFAVWLTGAGPLYPINPVALPPPQFEVWNANWNIAGIAVRVPDYSPSAVFPDAIPPVYKFEGGTYVPVTTVCDSNRGFWVKFPSTPPTQPITYTGTQIDSMSMPVSVGWNMIGSISAPIDTAAVQYSSPGMRLSVFFKYQNGYVIVDRLNPGLGFWVKSSQAGYMILENGATCPYEPEAEPPKDKFIVTDSEGNQQEMYVVNAEVSQGAQNIEMPPPPPEFDARWESGDFQIVVEPTSQPIELPIAINQAAFPITLEWELDPESGLEYVIVPDSGGLGKVATQVSESGRLNITSRTSRVRLVANREGTSTIKPMPKEFALTQNYPNPFNPSTVIRYQIPEASYVSLKVYDVLGREIATLVDEAKEAGYYEAVFDASSLGSGVYFYRMQAGSFNAVRKLLVVK